MASLQGEDISPITVYDAIFCAEKERLDRMKAKVYVNLKAGVLDPQGKAIQHSVELLGFSGISDIRQGKYFEISLDGSLDQTNAQASIEKIAREVLSNPIIEDYRVEVEG